jgi:Kelch motif protein
MGTMRDSPAVAPLPDGRVLVAGGSDGSSVVGTAEVFNPATNTFSPLPNPMANARQGAAAVPLPDGRVLIAGGYNPTLPGDWLSTAEVFNPATNAFTAVSGMGTVRSVPGGAPLPDGRALVIGGFDGNTVPQVRNTAEAFNPATNTFSSAGIGLMGARRDFVAAAPLADGHVLVAGGYDGNDALKSAEIFDPATGVFSSGGVGAMSVAREGAAASPLPDGRVLVAGGSPEGPILQSAEAFDPASKSFTSAGIGDLAAPRFGAGAAPLPDGRVLVVGGNSGGGPPLRSAETFTLAPASKALSFRVQGKRLLLDAPVSGTLSVSGAGGKKAVAAKKGKRPSLLKSTSASGGPGTITLKLKPLGAAKQRLLRKGKVRIRAALTFTPKGGDCVKFFKSCYSSQYATSQKAKLKIKLKKK